MFHVIRRNNLLSSLGSFKKSGIEVATQVLFIDPHHLHIEH